MEAALFINNGEWTAKQQSDGRGGRYVFCFSFYRLFILIVISYCLVFIPEIKNGDRRIQLLQHLKTSLPLNKFHPQVVYNGHALAYSSSPCRRHWWNHKYSIFSLLHNLTYLYHYSFQSPCTPTFRFCSNQRDHIKFDLLRPAACLSS